MSVQFPAGLDTFTNPTPTNPQNTPSHSQQHADANDAIRALEVKVGVDGSADPDSLDARVAALENSTGHTHVSGEIPAGAVNGSNAVFTLAHAPSPAQSLMLFLNGILQMAGGADFTLSSASVTFTEPPDVGSVLLAHYIV